MNIVRNYFGHFLMKTNLYYPDEMIADLNEISCFSNDPFSWLIGQFNKYALRLNDRTFNFVDKKIADIKKLKPLLG
jgi:hypothetical protein